MEEVVVPQLGICRSKGMTSRLVQTVQLSWSLQRWNLMRAAAEAEAELSLSCVLLSNRRIGFKGLKKYLQVLECAICWQQQNME